jgi:N-dimethylarginine dimethylaminohydrolase
LGGTEHITVIKPAPGLTELCFFGDSIFAIGKKALYGRLFCPERFAETEYAIEVTKALGFEGSRVPENMSFEGSGETLVWGEKILIGYGLRNSKEVVSYFKDYFAGGPEVIGLKLVDPYMYHLDTALFPVSNELVAVYNHAFDEKSN